MPTLAWHLLSPDEGGWLLAQPARNGQLRSSCLPDSAPCWLPWVGDTSWGVLSCLTPVPCPCGHYCIRSCATAAELWLGVGKEADTLLSRCAAHVAEGAGDRRETLPHPTRGTHSAWCPGALCRRAWVLVCCSIYPSSLGSREKQRYPALHMLLTEVVQGNEALGVPRFPPATPLALLQLLPACAG